MHIDKTHSEIHDEGMFLHLGYNDTLDQYITFNTYYIYGLPPDLISYVGPETVKIVLENTKSDYLFYFYNILEKKHIFSKNFKEHKIKLNEYRKKI